MQLARNTALNALAMGLPLVVGLWAIPVLMSGLGQANFGALTLIWAGIGYFSFWDLGLGRTLTQAIAQARGENNAALTSHQQYWGLWLSFFAGVLGALVVAPLLNLFGQNIGIAEANASAFLWAASLLPLVTLNSAIRGALEGHEAFVDASANKLLLGLLNFALPVGVVLVWGSSLLTVVWSLGLARLLAVLLGFISLRRLGFNAERVAVNKESLKDLFQMGGWLTLSNLVSPLMSFLDRYYLALMGGAAIAATYTVPQDFALRLLVVPVAMMSVWFPRMAFEGPAAGSTYKKGLKWLALGMFALLAILALLAKPLLAAWLGMEFAASSYRLGQILLLGLFFNSLAHLPLAALHANKRVKETSLLHVGELLLYIPLLLGLYKQGGVEGVAWAWTIRAMFDCAGLFAMHRIWIKPKWT